MISVHGEQDGSCNTDHSHHNRYPFSMDLLSQRLAGNTCGVRVQEGGGHGGEYNDQKACDPQPGLYHNLRDIRLSGKNRGSHTNHIHPAAYQTVNDCAKGHTFLSACIQAPVCFIVFLHYRSIFIKEQGLFKIFLYSFYYISPIQVQPGAFPFFAYRETRPQRSRRPYIPRKLRRHSSAYHRWGTI